MKKVWSVVCLLMVFCAWSPLAAQNKDNAMAWKEVDSLLNNQLPESAKTKVDELYKQAKKDANTIQTIKAFCYEVKLMAVFEEDGNQKAIDWMKEEIPQLPEPSKSVAYSLLGQTYWEYYSRNSWRIGQRTPLQDNQNPDIATWDMPRFVQEVTFCFNQSLSNARQLQNIKVDALGELLKGDVKYRPLRPTLFDLLVHKAIDIFKQSEYRFSQPEGNFKLDNPNLFASARQFSSLTFDNADTLSFKFRALQALQQLTAFHLQQGNTQALIDVDLIRLAYVRQNYVSKEADQLYIKALEDLTNVAKPYPIYTEVLYNQALYYCNQGNKYRNADEKTEENREGYIKAMLLCNTAMAAFPDSEGADCCEALKKNIQRPLLSLKTEQVVLPNQPIKALVDYKNLSSFTVKVYKLSQDSMLNLTNRYYWETELNLDVNKEYTVFQQQTINLAAKDDYQSYSTEIKLDELPLGAYLLIIELPGSEESTTKLSYKLNVSELSVISRSASQNTTSFYGVNRKTGNPLNQAKINLYSVDYSSKKRTRIASGVTNAQGIAQVAIDQNKYANFIELVWGADTLRQQFQRSYYYRDNESKNQTVFLTDRTLYRPGQTLHFKGILFSRDGNKSKVSPNIPTTVTLYDVNGQRVSSLNLRSNEFGSFNGTFTLPQGQLNGQVRLENESGSIYVSMEEYKRPTFEVTFQPVTANYSFNQLVKLTGEAKALAGYPIDKASANYTVTKARLMPFRYYWGGPVAQEQVAHGELKTDDKGNFEVQFNTLSPDRGFEDAVYIYTVNIDVTDGAGETRSAKTELKISAKPLVVGIDLPEAISPYDSLKYAVRTINLNDEFTSATMDVKVYSLKTPDKPLRSRLWEAPDYQILSKNEYHKYFPQDVYDDTEAEPEKYPTNKLVKEISLNTAQTKVMDCGFFRKLPASYYRVEYTAKNENGVEVRGKYTFRWLGEKPETISRADDWLTVVKATGEPGDTAEFRVASPGGEKTELLYELLRDGKIQETKRIKLGAKQQVFTVPITEADRGGFAVQFTVVENNRLYSVLQPVTVPYTNKQLDVKFETFRDKLLPGEKEQWKISIKTKGGEKEAAEMAATLYDASLDLLNPNGTPKQYWDLSPERFFTVAEYSRYSWYSYLFTQLNSGYSRYNSVSGSCSLSSKDYERIVYLDYLPSSNGWIMGLGLVAQESAAAPMAKQRVAYSANTRSEAKLTEMVVVEDKADYAEEAATGGAVLSDTEQPGFANITARENFNETAFFYPQLRTNEQGEIVIDFTIPESLTRWRMYGFTHTKDLKSGTLTSELITQKQVAISANAPRFFREGDTIVFSAKVNNLTEGTLTGKAQLELFNALTLEPLTNVLKTEAQPSFTVEKEGSTSLFFTLVIPSGVDAITYNLKAIAGTHTDGEEKTLPVLINRTLVTESLPFTVRGGQTKNVTFDKLVKNNSTTLTNQSYTVEFTSNPVWYAIQAMPYLMEYPHECAEQVFSRYYANSLAGFIVDGNPSIKRVFSQWKAENSAALLSNLEKNQELKAVLLEETPWVRDAQNETEQKNRIALLFDLNTMNNGKQSAVNKLQAMQNSNGSFPWFKGMGENRYITQHIAVGLVRLNKLGVTTDAAAKRIADRALTYADTKIKEDYANLLKKQNDPKRDAKNDVLAQNNLGTIQIHYLYLASFYAPTRKLDDKLQTACDYYLGQAERYWTQQNLYEQGLLALSLKRFGKVDAANKIVKSLKERAVKTDEMGMYWATNKAGYFWYQAPVETQSIMIEVFHEVGNDAKAVEELKIWLLRNKQTTNWKTTKATADACYALLMQGTKTLVTKTLDVKLNNQPLVDLKPEALKAEQGTGYVKAIFTAPEIKPDLGKITVTNPNANIAWGAAYWQYFENLDKVTTAAAGFQIEKQLYLKSTSGNTLVALSGNEKLKVGDKVKVRLILRADRDFEYVHLKDMRAVAFEPVDVLSSYRYQGGIGYYQSTKDAATHFFMDYVRKGTYVFEYDLWVTHAGSFSNGIATFQSMYAPEFNAHSDGIRVEVKEQNK